MAFGNEDDHIKVFREPLKVSVRDRLECMAELLDRGFGKPPQSHKVSGDAENPVTMAVQFYLPRNGRESK